MSTPALAVRDLQVSVSGPEGDAPILDGVDLEVEAGRVIGLIGESGSGKTTLASTVLGALPPAVRVSRGAILLAGLERPETGFSPGVAFVPQDPSTALDPLFTVGTQILDVLKARRPDLRTTASRRETALLHLRSVRLPEAEDLLRRLPHEVSGGQRQRIMIALALMIAPSLIVADEPTTALDLTVQAQILKLIRLLVDRSGAAMLITTHDPGVAHEICDSVAVMYAGRIVEQAPTQALLRRPRHPYTALLLAARTPRFRDVAGAAGTPPAPGSRPLGCPFHPRCPQRLDRCRTEPPPVMVKDGHMTRCWLAA